MLTPDGPKVIEFNVRFGDPEAQVVLPMIAEPLTPLLWAAATGVMRSGAVRVSDQPHVGVVLAAKGYPGDVRDRATHRRTRSSGHRMSGCAGVSCRREGKGWCLVTAGGRVMTIVDKGPTFEAAIARAYDAVSRIHFDGMQYRRDIGRKH